MKKGDIVLEKSMHPFISFSCQNYCEDFLENRPPVHSVYRNLQAIFRS